MKLIQKILVAVDFMRATDEVVAHAIHLAKTFHAEVVLLHVLPDDLNDAKITRLLEHAAEQRLAALRQELDAAEIPTVTPLIKKGRHFDMIVETADQLDANLIMIGAGQKDGEQEGYPLGTTAQKIIRWSDKPVWVVKPGQAPDIQTILCPVDFSAPSKLALKNAIILARRFQARLIVMSVFEQLSSRDMLYEKEWEAQEQAGKPEYKDEFDHFLDQFNLRDVDWTKVVRVGSPAKEIIGMLKAHDTDLLVMGTTGRSGLNRLMMGSVTEKVIRELPCTFITTKGEDMIKLRLENAIRDINTRCDSATQLVKDGFYQEAINEYLSCLQISNMHLPALSGLVKVYEKLGDQESAERYRQMAQQALRTIWNTQIEEEVRKGMRF